METEFVEMIHNLLRANGIKEFLDLELSNYKFRFELLKEMTFRNSSNSDIIIGNIKYMGKDWILLDVLEYKSKFPMLLSIKEIKKITLCS